MEITASIAFILLVILSLFQFSLALGAPFGRFAWSGKYAKLPKKLRISSLVAIGIYIVFALFISSKSGLATILPEGVILAGGMWLITAYLLVGSVANVLSRSKYERYTMTPVSLTLFVCFFIVAI